jgi:RNA polymerase sigma-70 factor (ECF subfamily)
MEMSDQGAVAAVRAGDRDAFRVLVEKHSRNIFRLGYRMTGNEQDAEEVVQETFLRAYRKIGDFEERANFGTWLYRIATNCSLDLLEKRKPMQKHTPIENDEGELLPLPAGTPSPERMLLSAELRRKLAVAMDDLTPMERSAFVLRHFENQSIEEIGKALSLKTNATKNSIYRAVQKLRHALGPLMQPGQTQ